MVGKGKRDGSAREKEEGSGVGIRHVHSFNLDSACRILGVLCSV
jgi:hypothetical protein